MPWKQHLAFPIADQNLSEEPRHVPPCQWVDFPDGLILDSLGQDELMAGRSALVTGAQQGIRAAIAVALVEEGANVALTWRDDEPGG